MWRNVAKNAGRFGGGIGVGILIVATVITIANVVASDEEEKADNQ